MHDALIPNDLIEDFIILPARVFTSKVRQSIIREVLIEEDLPVLEWQVLYSVARFGSCHLAHITRNSSIDPAHGSRAVAGLERKNLVTRSEDPNNKRRKMISLTPLGRETVERAWPKAHGVVKRVTDQLDVEDFNELKRLLKLLNKASDVLSEDSL